MAAVMQAYYGGCHCGALRVTFETTRAPAEIQRRADQCSFCRAHAGITISDPEGAVRIDAKAEAFQFGHAALQVIAFQVGGGRDHGDGVTRAQCLWFDECIGHSAAIIAHGFSAKTVCQ